MSAIEINPGEYSGRISGDDSIDKWYKFERPNTYFNQIKEQVKQHVSTLERFESLDQPLLFNSALTHLTWKPFKILISAWNSASKVA